MQLAFCTAVMDKDPWRLPAPRSSSPALFGDCDLLAATLPAVSGGAGKLNEMDAPGPAERSGVRIGAYSTPAPLPHHSGIIQCICRARPSQ